MAAPSASPALTNFQSSLNTAAGSAHLGNAADVATIIASGINVILSLSGLLLVIYLVYAGILYMQAGLDSGKAKTAKQLITNAIIGIVIILAAYAITNFVLFSLGTAVGVTPGA